MARCRLRRHRAVQAAIRRCPDISVPYGAGRVQAGIQRLWFYPDCHHPVLICRLFVLRGERARKAVRKKIRKRVVGRQGGMPNERVPKKV